MQQCGRAAQPSHPEGCWDPTLSTKALQEQPHCPHPTPAWLSRILLLPSPAHVAAQLKAWPKGSDFMQQMHL